MSERMSERDQVGVKALLCVLQKVGQCGEEVIHPTIEQVPLGPGRTLVRELREWTALAEKEGWIAGILGPFGNVKWSITDKGKAARLEM